MERIEKLNIVEYKKFWKNLPYKFKAKINGNHASLDRITTDLALKLMDLKTPEGRIPFYEDHYQIKNEKGSKTGAILFTEEMFHGASSDRFRYDYHSALYGFKVNKEIIKGQLIKETLLYKFKQAELPYLELGKIEKGVLEYFGGGIGEMGGGLHLLRRFDLKKIK